MKNKTFIALFAALIAVLLVVTGCTNLTGADTALPAGKGKLVLSINGVNARTIVPTGTAVYAYDVYAAADVIEAEGVLAGLTAVASGEVPKAANTAVVLAPGTYLVKVSALLGATVTDGVVSGGTVYATGFIGEYTPAEDPEDEATIEGGLVIEAGVTATKTVTLVAQIATDVKGTFSWNLEAFNTKTVTVTIYDQTDGEFNTTAILESGDLEATADHEAATPVYAFTDEYELDAGEYLVVFTADTVEWSEVLWIWGGFESAYAPAFSDVEGEAPTGLLAVVLKAIDEGKPVAFSYYDLLDIKVGDDEEFYDDDVSAAIAAILAEDADADDNPDNAAPATETELKELIDAALIRAGIDAIIADDAFDGTDVTAIEALALNETTISVDVTKFEDDDEVTVTAGSYTFTVKKGVALVVDKVWLTLDLSKYYEGDYNSGAYSGAPKAGVAYADGTLTVSLQTAWRPTWWIGLTEAQIAAVKAVGMAGSFKVVIIGNDSTGASDYRFAFANPNPPGSAWNISNLPAGSIASFAAGAKVTLTADPAADGENRAEYIVLQKNGTPAEAYEITITSIKIKLVK